MFEIVVGAAAVWVCGMLYRDGRNKGIGRTWGEKSPYEGFEPPEPQGSALWWPLLPLWRLGYRHGVAVEEKRKNAWRVAQKLRGHEPDNAAQMIKSWQQQRQQFPVVFPASQTQTTAGTASDTAWIFDHATESWRHK